MYLCLSIVANKVVASSTILHYLLKMSDHNMQF